MIPLKDNIPTRRVPVITIAIIALNVWVYLQGLALSPGEFQRFLVIYGVIPAEISQGIPLVRHPVPLYATILTSMFVHGGLFHVGGNMLYLWIFGNNVEDAMGRGRFLCFYGACGVVAALTQVYVSPLSQTPVVGASGAISGVLGAYLLLYPYARVVTLVTLGWFWRLLEIPAVLVLGFWIVVQLLNGFLTFTFEGGGVAWFAHVGGFAAGMGLVAVFKRRAVSLGWRRRLWS